MAKVHIELDADDVLTNGPELLRMLVLDYRDLDVHLVRADGEVLSVVKGIRR